MTHHSEHSYKGVPVALQSGMQIYSTQGTRSGIPDQHYLRDNHHSYTSVRLFSGRTLHAKSYAVVKLHSGNGPLRSRSKESIDKRSAL